MVIKSLSAAAAVSRLVHVHRPFSETFEMALSVFQAFSLSPLNQSFAQIFPHSSSLAGPPHLSQSMVPTAHATGHQADVLTGTCVTLVPTKMAVSVNI